MKIKGIFGILAVCAVFLVSACSQSGDARIAISAEGMQDSTMVVVSRLAYNEVDPMDTLYIKGGKTGVKIQVAEGAPQFIYLSIDGAARLPLVVLNGDDIRVCISEDGSFTVEGSEESLRMMELENSIDAFNEEFLKWYALASVEPTRQNASDIKEAKTKLGSMYVERRKEAIRYIYQHPKSITLIPVLYQKTPNGMPLFAQNTDVMLMRRVYDSLHPVYPTSPYLVSLADEIVLRQGNIVMDAHLRQAELVDFPEIALSDINGVEQRLSSLKGKTVVLLFWNSPNAEQRLFTTELKSVYDKLHSRGLEIYQVGVETDKTAWALQVKEQNLPWINVCDPTGGVSGPVQMYNVQSLPAMYVISKDGSIVAKDIFDLDKLEAELRKLL